MKQLSSRELDVGLPLLAVEGLALDETFDGCTIVSRGYRLGFARDVMYHNIYSRFL